MSRFADFSRYISQPRLASPTENRTHMIYYRIRYANMQPTPAYGGVISVYMHECIFTTAFTDMMCAERLSTSHIMLLQNWVVKSNCHSILSSSQRQLTNAFVNSVTVGIFWYRWSRPTIQSISFRLSRVRKLESHILVSPRDSETCQFANCPSQSFDCSRHQSRELMTFTTGINQLGLMT